MIHKLSCFILSLFLPLFTPLPLQINVTEAATLTLEAPNLPLFEDEAFESASIRIETFGRESCPYCQTLKNNFYSHLNLSTSDLTIAARYYNLENKAIKAYFDEWEGKFNLTEGLKGAIPATIINGTYLILGYNETSTPHYLNLIEQIRRGETIEENPDNYLFVIKKEYYQPSNPIFFSLSDSLEPFKWIRRTIWTCAILCVSGLGYYYYRSKKSLD